MDTASIDDPHSRGTWLLKAARLSIDEKSEFSQAVDSLADWFHGRFMGQA
jgi:hypothetical protein